MNIDVFIKRAKEKAEEYKYRASFFESDNPVNAACIKVAKDHEQLAKWFEKFKEYQQLEEQGRLIKLPCKVGDTVYFIKNSETIVKCKADMIFIGIFWEEFGKKWFPTREEAEAKLKELRGQ